MELPNLLVLDRKLLPEKLELRAVAPGRGPID
jgi:hypothetical protein